MTLEIVFAFGNEFPGVVTEQRRISRDERFFRFNVSSSRRVEWTGGLPNG